MKKLIIFLILISVAPLTGEIQTLEVSWRAETCWESCARSLEKQLDRVGGIQDFSINQPGGFAIINWKPNVPFDLISISNALRMVGLTMEQLKLSVKGKIVSNRSGATLVSSGDGSSFVLISPLTPSMTEQVTRFTPQNRELSADTREKLVEAEAQGQLATIDGVLLRPARLPPYYLIIERIRFSKPEENSKSKNYKK